MHGLLPSATDLNGGFGLDALVRSIGPEQLVLQASQRDDRFLSIHGIVCTVPFSLAPPNDSRRKYSSRLALLAWNCSIRAFEFESLVKTRREISSASTE